MQKEVFEKFPDQNLRAYVIWEPMVPTDRLKSTRFDLITDARAIHFEDHAMVSGKWFAENLPDCTSLGPIAWDAFYLFGAEAEWGDTPGPVIACGTPVIQNKEKLLKSLGDR